MSTGKIVSANVAEAGEAPGLALRDACLAEIERAEASLGAAARAPHRAIHQARKAVRRARAALALAGSGDDATATVDKVLQRMARGLSRMRDAAVAVETYERMVRHAALRSAAESLRPLRAGLVGQCAGALSAYLRRDPAFEHLRSRLRDANGKVRTLPWGDVGARAVGRAMRKAAQRADKAGAKARGRFEENLRHRWRRRLRRLNDQRVLIDDLMSGAWPAEIADRHELAAGLQRIEAKHAQSWHRPAGTAHTLGLERDALHLRRIAGTTSVLDGAVRDRLVTALDRRLRKLHKRVEE